MRDIQFISMSDNIKVTLVQDLGDGYITLFVSPTARYIDRVEITSFISGIEVLNFKDYSLMGETSIRFKIPNSLVGQNFENLDYSFLTSTLTSNKKVKLTFSPTMKIKSVSGTQKLIQQIIKILISHRASNRFSKKEGGNLLKSLGNISPEAEGSVVAASVVESLDAVEEFITEKQLGVSIPPDEKLVSLEANRFIPSEDGSLSVIIRLRTLAGDDISIPVQL